VFWPLGRGVQPCCAPTGPALNRTKRAGNLPEDGAAGL